MNVVGNIKISAFYINQKKKKKKDFYGILRLPKDFT